MGNPSTGAMQQFEPPSGSKPSYRDAGLVLLYAEQFQQLPAGWRLTGTRSVVGRVAPADICIDVAAVSRNHAEVTYERGGFTLRDLDSTNGTFVDGRRVREARLEHGQDLRIGDAILKFVEHDIEDYCRYRLDGSVEFQTERWCGRVPGLVGGYQLDGIARELCRIASSDLSVIVLGESGTGKEVVARELHRLSQRRGTFCAINCAAIPADLLESELFGYKRGAFSGAERDKPGLIRTAHQGTLLLDEIGDMPLSAQAKLLRVLQAREVFPLGATRPEPVDIRVVCATHRDLARMQNDNRFRQDLFARLNEYQLHLPSLRERKEDIYQLLCAFLKRHGNPSLQPTFRFMTALLQYDWPYNVRELEACAKRCIALCEGKLLEVEHLPGAIRDEMADYGRWAGLPTEASEAPGKGPPSEEQLRELLSRHKGNVAAVGRELGKARMQIHRWLQRYSISLDEYREQSS